MGTCWQQFVALSILNMVFYEHVLVVSPMIYCTWQFQLIFKSTGGKHCCLSKKCPFNIEEFHKCSCIFTIMYLFSDTMFVIHYLSDQIIRSLTMTCPSWIYILYIHSLTWYSVCYVGKTNLENLAKQTTKKPYSIWSISYILLKKKTQFTEI